MERTIIAYLSSIASLLPCSPEPTQGPTVSTTDPAKQPRYRQESLSPRSRSGGVLVAYLRLGALPFRRPRAILAAYYGPCRRSVPPGLLKRALHGQPQQARVAIRAHPPVRVAAAPAEQAGGAAVSDALQAGAACHAGTRPHLLTLSANSKAARPAAQLRHSRVGSPMNFAHGQFVTISDSASRMASNASCHFWAR